MKTISVRTLKKLGACSAQVGLFEHIFGVKSVLITLGKCKRAAFVGLNMNWAAQNLLPPPARRAYTKAHKVAYRAFQLVSWLPHTDREAAWRAYEEATATAFFEAWRNQ